MLVGSPASLVFAMPTGPAYSTGHWGFRFVVFFFDCEAGGGETVGSMGLLKYGTYERGNVGIAGGRSDQL